MVSIIVGIFIFLMAIYYVDVIINIVKDEKQEIVRYKGIKLVIPFAYWFAPPKVVTTKRTRNVKSKKRTNEKK